MFLNFGTYPNQTFTLVLWSEALAAFQAAGVDPTTLVGTTVTATGVVTEYNRRPQMVIEVPSQLQKPVAPARLQGTAPRSKNLVIQSPPTVRELALLTHLNPVQLLRAFIDNGVLVTMDQKVPVDKAARVLANLGVLVSHTQTTPTPPSTPYVGSSSRRQTPAPPGASKEAMPIQDARTLNKLYQGRPASKAPALTNISPRQRPSVVRPPQASPAKQARPEKTIPCILVLSIVGYWLWGFWGLLGGAIAGYLLAQRL
jgi:hypothetical protein